MGGVKLFIALIVVSIAIGGQWVGAQVHHVVGGDRGWDPSSDIGSWSSGKIFTVGDKIWFTYSAAQESIVEIKTKEEYEACDVTNPIRMYTNGLDRVSLEEEGIRYFASGSAQSCKNGLKLHVETHKHHISAVVTSEGSAKVTADGPTSPSASAHLNGFLYLVFVGILLCHLINLGL